MNAAKIRCSHTGCSEIGPWEQMKTHVNFTCPHMKVVCQYPQCAKTMTMQQWMETNHESSCDYRPCPYCHMSLANDEDHLSVCSGASVTPKCLDCQQVLRPSDLDTHKELFCLYQLTSCHICDFETDIVTPFFLRKDRMAHMKEYRNHHTILLQEKEELRLRTQEALAVSPRGTKRRVGWLPSVPAKRKGEL